MESVDQIKVINKNIILIEHIKNRNSFGHSIDNFRTEIEKLNSLNQNKWSNLEETNKNSHRSVDPGAQRKSQIGPEIEANLDSAMNMRRRQSIQVKSSPMFKNSFAIRNHDIIEMTEDDVFKLVKF